MMSVTLHWCLYCLLWTDFTTFTSFSIADFEKLNVCWEWVNNRSRLTIKTLGQRFLHVFLIFLLMTLKRYASSSLFYPKVMITTPDLKTSQWSEFLMIICELKRSNETVWNASSSNSLLCAPDNDTNDKTLVKNATQLMEGSRTPLHKKWSFALSISLANVNKSMKNSTW